MLFLTHFTHAIPYTVIINSINLLALAVFIHSEE